MRYYMLSEDSSHVDTLNQIMQMAVERYNFFKPRVEALGFEEMGMHAFGVPIFFCKRCEDQTNPPRKGVKIPGFKGGERIHENGTYYFKYTVSGRGAKFYSELCDGAPSNPAELSGDNYYRRQDVDAVFAARLGLPDGVFNDRAILFASVWLLHNKTMVACSIPYGEDGSKEDKPAVIPAGFIEVTERALQSEIKKHNDNLEA